MRVRMERFILLPFTLSCMSDSSIPVGLQQQVKRSRLDTNLTPGEKGEGDEEHEEEYDEESLSGENLRSPSNLLALPKFQKLFKNFKNFSQSFVYKDEFEETDIGIEIGLPTDVKHVTHIGLDGCSSSIFSKEWFHEPDQTITLPHLPLTPLDLAMASHNDKPTFQSLLETT